MKTGPRALLITSHPPDPDLYGGTQRVLAWTRALATRYSLDLLELRPMSLRPEVEILVSRRLAVPPIAWWDPLASFWWLLARIAPGAFVRMAQRRRFWRLVTPLHLARVRSLLRPRSYQLVVAYTLEGATWAQALEDRFVGSERVFDLPDIESSKLARDAALLEMLGESREAAVVTLESAACRRLERSLLGPGAQVFVCSEADRQDLLEWCPDALIRVAPNVAMGRPRAPAPTTRSGPVRLLMVGDMAYLPNRDAVRFFLDEVAPCLDQELCEGWRLELVGRGSEDLALEASSLLGRVSGRGWVEDVIPFYAEADIVVVPVRTGGGTRTKILEAFQVGRPVVSTTLGAEGLAAVSGVHLLVADSGVAIAAACGRLAADPGLGGRLVEAAHELVEARYGQAAFDAAVLRDSG